MKKQQTRNKLTRITIALLLILSMLGNTLILPVVAQESAVSADSVIANNGEIANASAENISGLDSGNASLIEADKDLVPLEEDESLRDAFTKHYIDPDGTRHAIIFPEQVHYLEGEEWVEIDNTLTYDSNSKKYISSNRKFVAKFSDDVASDQLVSITDGNYTLSWSISFVDKAPITASPSARSSMATEEISATISSAKGTLLNYESSDNAIKHRGNISNMGKAVSGVKYEKVFNNSVDLRYSVLHGKVEEDVILNSPDNFTSYILTVNTTGLTAVKQTDNSIEFINGQGETVFTLAAPWMKDARVAVSDDIDVTVTQKGAYAYIKYTPNAEWLNDESRAYPVLIDPSFTTRFYTNNYEDTYVYEGDSSSTTRPTETLMPIGNIDGNSYYAYIKILNIPDLLDARTIENATFTFWTSASDLPGLDVSVVTDTWSSTTITYATQPSSFCIARNIFGSPMAFGDAHYVNLTDWLNNIYYSQEYVGGISGFFKSDSWNGFKIGYTLESENEYTHIYSSEFHTPSCRPTLSISYTYTPPDYLEHGMVVEIVNASTAKRMTVHNVSPANGTNIYQAAGNGSLSQAFKLLYVEGSQSFRIQALRTIASSESVLDFQYNSTTDPYFNDYKDANVRLYESSPSRAENQEWLIIPNGSDSYSQTYRIVSRADPNLALTCYGSGDGSATGTTSTSMGNIFVSEYTGASNQRWWIFTGGNFLLTGLNIKTTTRNNFECPEDTHRYTFTCPVSNYGDSVSWSSSNPYVATVSNGRVTCVKAGEAIITATVTRAGETIGEYEKTIYTTLADGVYYLHNVETNARLEYFNAGCINENDCLEAWYGGTSQNEPGANQRYAMFKIKHLGEGVYTIRSMLKSDMGFKYSFGKSSLFSVTIGTDDDSLSSFMKWQIGSNANGYYIHNAGRTHKTITAPASDLEYEVTLTPYDEINTLQNWTLLPVTTAYHGVNIRQKVDALRAGDTYQFSASMYSSFTNENGQRGFIWSVINDEGSATIDPETGELTGISPGNVTITATYRHSSSQTWNAHIIVNIYKKAVIIIPGIMGSQIFAKEDITVPSSSLGDATNTFPQGTRLWDPSTVSSQLVLIDEKILALACDSFGNPLYPTTVNAPTINQYNLGGEFQYGATDIYRRIYNAMYESFYDDNCDIVFYEYDWRKDPYDTSIELSEFIEQQHYGDIVFVSHSMGGLVSSYYLSLGEDRRNLVDKHISVGTPYLGSVEMPHIYVTGNIRDSMYQNWIVSDSVTRIVSNIPSIYALFPFAQNWSSYMRYYSAPETITPCEDYALTMCVLSQYMPNWNNVMAENVFENRERLFTSDGAHITTLVDSYYIVGTGESTSYETTGVMHDLIALDYFNMFELRKNVNGDGTVTLYSATIGNTISNEKTYYKQSSSAKTATHVGMISGEDDNIEGIDMSTIYFITEIIGETVDNYSDEQLYSLFGISN